jgi:hypothetical protein
MESELNFNLSADLDDDEVAESVIALNADETALEIVEAPKSNGKCEPEQAALFEKGEWWEEHWKGMPDFHQEDLMPWKTVSVHFECIEDMESFAELVGQKIGDRTKSIWHPEAETAHMKDKRYFGDAQPKWPFYIVSKGRWESRLTSKTLHNLNVKHFIVIEEQEYLSYKAVIDSSVTLLVLDKKYQEDYDTCDDLGASKSRGPGPARNFAWDHAQNVLRSGWHWVADDNIDGFARLR